jgi:dTDP-glucose 4,6-dehydratase
MRVLVTGGAGFIGSHYVRCALSGAFPALDDAHIIVADKFTYAGNPRNLDPVADSPRLTVKDGDIVDPHFVDDVVAGTDLVVHFAAESHVDRSITGAAQFMVTNVLGTQTLLEAAVRHRIRCFVHVSTDEVYGSIDTGSWTESAPVQPNSPYAASKAGSDLIARAYGRTHGLDVRITRCSNNYGPYQFPEKLIPLFITNLLDGAQVPLYGDGGNVRDWLHVHDHCRGIQLVLEDGRPGEIYNIGGGTQLTNRELAERLVTACGAQRSQIRYVPDRLGHDRRYCVDTAWRRSRGSRAG